MNLPHHRRYQWRLVWKGARVAVWLTAFAVVLAVMLCLVTKLLLEQNRRIEAENRNAELIADMYRLASFGAPAYVTTDWEEGTHTIDQQRPIAFPVKAERPPKPQPCTSYTDLPPQPARM